MISATEIHARLAATFDKALESHDLATASRACFKLLHLDGFISDDELLEAEQEFEAIFGAVPPTIGALTRRPRRVGGFSSVNDRECERPRGASGRSPRPRKTDRRFWVHDFDRRPHCYEEYTDERCHFADGRGKCERWVRRGFGHFCAEHADGRQRCIARLADGTRCCNQTPPLTTPYCNAHSPGAIAERKARRATLGRHASPRVVH